MREIIIIKTDNSEKLKSALNDKEINYSIIYDDILTNNEEEIWRRDIRLANQDGLRNKEITELDTISDEDEWENINANDGNWN